jgi:putative tricarboxylic transport membrane protein
MFHNVILGFSVAFTPDNLLWCLIGVIIGTIVGLLPGLGSATGVALLLPLTVNFEPVTGLIMLAGIYYGCQYGSSIASTLIATPGDSASVVVTLDGYPMAKQGRGGQALAASAIGSFVAGTITIIPLMVLAPAFAHIAIKFGPPELFALMTLGLAGVIGFTGSSQSKGLAMAAFGVVIGTIGLDPQSGVARFTFGQVSMVNGIDFLPIVIGLFAIGEVLTQVGAGSHKPIRTKMRDMIMRRSDLRQLPKPVARGGVLGFLLGILPGAGATLASFFAYDVERRFSKHPERFGKGEIAGVAAPEAANNAATNGAFVPTLTLGIPGSGTTAVLLGAFLLYGVQPGPLLLSKQPDIAWGLMASFYIGNILLIVLNLPLAPFFASLLRVRYSFLYPMIITLSLIGAFALQNRMFSVWVAIVFGLIGYFMKRYDWPTVPLLLGVILGPLMEKNLVQTSQASGGDMTVFFRHPIALAIFGIAALVIAGPLIRNLINRLKPSGNLSKENVDRGEKVGTGK